MSGCPIMIDVEIYDNGTNKELINKGLSVCSTSHAAQLLREWADELEQSK